MFLNQSTKPTARHYTILAMAWAGWTFDFYDLMLFSFLLVPIKHNLGLSDSQLSLLLGVSLASTAAGGLVFGWMADRFGRKPVLSVTILTYSLGTFLCGFSSSLQLLLLFRIVTGLGVGGEWATGQTLVGETFPPRMRARFAAIMQTGAPVGIALATVVGAFVEPFFARTFGPGGRGLSLGVTWGVPVLDYSYLKVEVEAIQAADVGKGRLVARLHSGFFPYRPEGNPDDSVPGHPHRIPAGELFTLGGRDALRGLRDAPFGTDELHLTVEAFVPVFVARNVSEGLVDPRIQPIEEFKGVDELAGSV